MRSLAICFTTRTGAAAGGGGEAEDVTGGIVRKAELALAIARGGTEVAILNGRKKGRLLEALKGRPEL